MKDRLGNHIQQVRGVSYKPNDLSETLSDGYTTLLRANNISEGKINFDSVQFVSSSKVSPEQILKSNDILVCSSSGSLSLVGKSALYKKTGEHTFGAFCKVVRATGKLLPQYIAFYMCSQAYRRHIENIANGANINNLRNEHLDEILLSIPSEDKQNAIIAKLEKVESVITHRRTQLAKLDELVKCRFVEMFGDAKNNPYGWVSVTVDSVTEEILGGVSVSGEARKIQKGELAVLKVSAVTYGVFKCDEYKVISNDIKLGKFVSPKKGDLLFSRANTKELVGATALVDKDYPHLLLPDKIWKIVVSDKVSPVYLKAYLSEPWIRELMSKVATGTSGSMYNISMEKLRQIPVLLPPIERQNAFASFVQRIDKLRIDVQAALDKAQTLFDSLMQEYFG